MKLEKDLYFNKKILIYGLGISGISSFNNLKKNNIISCFDDNLKNLKNTVNDIKKITTFLYYFKILNNASSAAFSLISILFPVKICFLQIQLFV